MSMPRAIILHPNDGCHTVARVLVRRGVQVHALTTPETRHVLASRGVRGRVMPDVRTHPEAWREELLSLAATGGGVVLCGSDASGEWLGRYRAQLPASLRSFESTDGIHLALMDKLRLYRMAAEIGVKAPWMHHVTTRGELDRLCDELAYPCVLKARLGHLAKELTGVGTRRIGCRAELLEHAGLLLAHGVDLLLTEVVPGPETGLEAAVTIRTGDGDYPLEYGRIKLRQWPLDYGVGSLQEAAAVPETLKMSRRLLDHVGFVGIASCETKRHEGTGERYLIEINVRPPGSFGLADACGVDGSWRLYAALAGIPLGPQPPQIDGRRSMIPHLDLLAAVQRLRRGDAGIGAVLRSWRGVRNFGVLDVRDPVPAVVQAGQMIRKRVSGRSRRRSDAG
jgi:D-aspartate ligase